MSTLVTINGSDLPTNSRADINNNFNALNTDKMETSVLDTDTTLAANSDSKVPTQKAVKAYVDAGGNVNASTTAKGIVEEATATELAAGTAAGGTSARLYVNPSAITRALTVIPTPNGYYNAVNQLKAISGNTTQFLGQILVPAPITINKVSFQVTTSSVTGTFDVSLYSEDGQTQLFSVTTASVSGTGVVTTAVSSVSIQPGVYYIGINANSTASATVAAYKLDYNGTASLINVSSEPVTAGTATITADTPATTFTPSSLTAVVDATIAVRFDN